MAGPTSCSMPRARQSVICWTQTRRTFSAKQFPAQLAIGFTSQYQVVTGRVHMAGTRGTLQSHILVREWSQHMSEPERLELLVHELGHFLGASPNPPPPHPIPPL